MKKKNKKNTDWKHLLLELKQQKPAQGQVLKNYTRYMYIHQLGRLCLPNVKIMMVMNSGSRARITSAGGLRRLI